MLYVADDRTTQSLGGFYKTLNAQNKIAFDNFHVTKYLGDALDKVRREEHRTLQRNDDTRLNRTRYQWFTNPNNMSRGQKLHFVQLRECTLRTARA